MWPSSSGCLPCSCSCSARAHRSDFVLDAAQATDVAELVTRLEGIPLALELAAARVRSLAVVDINARLKDRYKLLTGGNRGLQQRQQTLRALVDWSYDLLPSAEQTLLQRLGIFSGGFDLAAAEAVCGTEPLDALDVLDLLDRLVENSLVVMGSHTGGSPGRATDSTRYSMLETLREYAQEKLQQSGDIAATAKRHCEHFFGFAKQVREGLRAAQQAHWVQRAEVELDNLRGAMAAARAGHADPLLAAKLPVALQSFWILRGYLSEGREHIRVALALPAIQASDIGRAHTLYVAAALANVQGDPAEAEQLLETCLALRRGLQDVADIAATLSALAMARLATGQSAAALAAEQEALPLFRSIGHRAGEAAGLLHLGQIQMRLGHTQAAVEHLKLSLDLTKSIEHLEAECECELLLGECAQAEGDMASAQAHMQRSLQRCREAADRNNEAKAQGALGRLALVQRDVASAQPLLAAALRAFDRYEMRSELIASLEDHAGLAFVLGRHKTAARLLAAASLSRSVLGLPQAHDVHTRCMALREALQTQLGPTGWAMAEAAAEAATLGDAVKAALALRPQGPR